MDGKNRRVPRDRNCFILSTRADEALEARDRHVSLRSLASVPAFRTYFQSSYSGMYFELSPSLLYQGFLFNRRQNVLDHDGVFYDVPL